jgi:signal transduction histidine kinase
MELFLNVFRRKRGVILFIAAFMLPLLFVVVVSIDTFSKRQKTTRNLLESNLWLSGRSALNLFELQFNEIENSWLNAEYFRSILMGDSLKLFDKNPNMFLIDQDFQVVYPETCEDKDMYFLSYDRSWNSGYRKYMGRAETAELNRRSYSNAVKNYQMSLGLAETTQQEALAIEGMARSHMAGQNYRLAIRYYQLLKNEYSQTENLGGHLYGITAPLQLNAMGTLIGEEVFGQDSIHIIYQMIKDGHWLISPSSYFFFKAEYESMLEIEIDTTDSKFESILEFNQFLGDFVIPSIKERSGFSEFNKAVETKRIYIHADDGQYLISFKEMLIPDADKLYFVGIRWNLDTIITQVIPPILAGLMEETGLEFWLVNGNNTNLLTSKAARIPDESLTFSFSNIPFPWTLVAIQPGYKKLESDAMVQMMIYGLLVFIIIILMFFGVFVLLRDISRETDSMHLQTEFVHNVSHELKTPLSLIRLYGETLLLKEHLPEADRKEGLQIITKESERLSYMINNILDFSKIEMGRKEFAMKSGNLTEVVLNTLDSYRYHFEKKGFTVEEEIDHDIPKIVFDKNAVQGILINLFSNAIKFSTNTKRLLVKLKNISEGIYFEVADKGIGIPLDELPNIFNRFYRVKNNTGFEARGSGLGLTLVKHAIDAHGWQIKVKSTPGQGSSFSISIPLKTKKEEQK